MRVCSLCRVTPGGPGDCARMVAHAGTVLWGPGPQAGARTGLRSRAATPPSGCSSRGASAGRTVTPTGAASRRCTNRTRAGSAGRAKKLGFSFSDRGNCAHEHTFTLKCGAQVRYFWYKDHTHTVLNVLCFAAFQARCLPHRSRGWSLASQCGPECAISGR